MVEAVAAAAAVVARTVDDSVEVVAVDRRSVVISSIYRLKHLKARLKIYEDKHSIEIPIIDNLNENYMLFRCYA